MAGRKLRRIERRLLWQQKSFEDGETVSFAFAEDIEKAHSRIPRGREDAFLCDPDIFYGKEGPGVELLDHADNRFHFFPIHDGENQFNRSRGSCSIDNGYAVPRFSQGSDKVRGLYLGYDPDNHSAHGQSFFKDNAHEITGREAAGIGEIVQGTGEVPKNLADCQQPDHELKEAEDRRKELETSGYVNNTDCSQRNVDNAG